MSGQRKLILDMTGELTSFDDGSSIVVHVTQDEKTEKRYQYQYVQDEIKNQLMLTENLITKHLVCFCQNSLDYIIYNNYKYNDIYMNSLSDYSFYDSKFLLFLDSISKQLTDDGKFHAKIINHEKYMKLALEHESANKWSFNKVRKYTKLLCGNSLWTENLTRYYISEFTDLNILEIKHSDNDNHLLLLAEKSKGDSSNE